MKKKKFIIVEDVQMLCDILRKILESSYDCKVIEAVDGEEGLQTFINEGADLIITDYDFKTLNMNGLQMIESIRNIDSKVPIVLLSACDRLGACALTDELNFTFCDKTWFYKNHTTVLTALEKK